MTFVVESAGVLEAVWTFQADPQRPLLTGVGQHGIVIDAESNMRRQGHGSAILARRLHVKDKAYTPVGALRDIGHPTLDVDVLTFQHRIKRVVEQQAGAQRKPQRPGEKKYQWDQTWLIACQPDGGH